MSQDIPVTYVPARNTVMLSLALAWAEVIGAEEIHVGVNAVDYSGYPDCRPEFLAAFERLARVATKAGVGGRPLADRGAAAAALQGRDHPARHPARRPLRPDHSCYDPVRGRACGRCDACQLRRKGFDEAGIPDPTPYVRAAKRRT